MNNARRPVAAAVAVAALLAAGCQRGGTPPTSSAPQAPTSSIPTPKNLVTPESAGRPVLNLKFGEPVTFRKGGITLTITAKSLEKLDGNPPDKSDPDEKCGVWWKVSEQIVVDAEPNATWKKWAVDLQPLGGLQKDTRGRGREYDNIPVTDPGEGSDRFVNLAYPAEAEREKNISISFHKVFETKEYYGMCTEMDGGEPSGLEPLGADVAFSDIPEGTLKPTTIARWLR